MISIDNFRLYFFENRYVDIGIVSSDHIIDNIIGIKYNDDGYMLNLWGHDKLTMDRHNIDSIIKDDNSIWYIIIIDGVDDV
jgi:hypothetical protein